MDEKNWHLKSSEEVLHILNTSREGLSSIDAKDRLDRIGPNKIENTKDPSLWLLFFRQFLTPFVLILSIAVGVKFFTNNLLDAIVLVVTILLMVLIGFFQEMKAEKALRALKQLSAHKSKALREGKMQVIPSELLVPGDIISLEVGDTIPADARIIESVHLKMKESMLTGESVPSEKNANPLEGSFILSDRTNMVYMGTVVVYGKASAVVTDTGMATSLGKIAKSIGEIKQEVTPLQKNIRSIGRWMLLFIFFAVFCFGWISFYRGISLVDVLLLSVAAMISAIPEGLPVAFTVTFAAGMYAMAKKNAIIRKLTAVETLGSTTVICSDKTGTLTLNQMTVKTIYTLNQPYDSQSLTRMDDPVLMQALKIGVLCNDARVVKNRDVDEIIGDPTEGALLIAADRASLNRDEILQANPRAEEIPFLSENLYMATAHVFENKRIVCVKGAPEKILALSQSVLSREGPKPMDEGLKQEINQAIEQMTAKALRLIAVAYCELDLENKDLSEDQFAGKLHFTGIFGMEDPPRKEVLEAIELCHKAGIRVVMITGDNPRTALAIAQELKIPTEGVIIGQEIANMSDDELRDKILKIGVFARVEPDHKLRIVKAFQHIGHIVSMTGDGVNDAPALEAANIGISMGISGTDVAKEASDMVLADDRFDSIVAAIEEGRAIYHRLRNVCAFLMTTCFGELFGLIMSVFFTGIAPLLPLQILWINLVSGSVIAIPLGVEPKYGDEMIHPPRHPDSKFIHRGMVYRMIYMAVLLGLGAFLIFTSNFERVSIETARTMVLCSIIVFEWLIGFQMRSDEIPLRKIGFFKNTPLLWAVGFTLAMHLMILYVPFLRFLFGLEILTLGQWGIALIPGLTIFILETLRKEIFPTMFSQGKWHSINQK